MDNNTKPIRARFTLKPNFKKATPQKAGPKTIAVSEFKVPYLSLVGQVLLPLGLLPLHITTAQEIAMVKQALSGTKTIAVIQPKYVKASQKTLYKVGCLGQITTYSENTDGSLYVVIKGTQKIRALSIKNDLLNGMYVKSEFISKQQGKMPILNGAYDDQDRHAFLGDVETFLKTKNLTFKTQDLKDSSDEALITSLTIACPFDANEKQAILESNCTKDQLAMIASFIKMRDYKPQSTLMH